jgi:hypothetical protein
MKRYSPRKMGDEMPMMGESPMKAPSVRMMHVRALQDTLKLSPKDAERLAEAICALSKEEPYPEEESSTPLPRK